MLSKRTIYFIVINIILAIGMYLIYKIKFDTSSGTKQNFTSVGSKLVLANNNIWVVDSENSQLVEFDFKGNKITQLQTGYNPSSAISFGAYIWETNYSDDNISEVLLTNGALQNVGLGSLSGPTCCAYDGTNIWVVSFSGYCTVFNPTTTTIVKSMYIGRENLTCCLFDGTNVWITLGNSGYVLLMDIGDFSTTNKFKVGDAPIRMSFSNDYLYVLNSDSVSKVDQQGVQATIQLHGDSYTDIVCDDSSIWISASSGNISCYDIKTNNFTSGFSAGNNANYILLLQDSIVVADEIQNKLGFFKKDNTIINYVKF